MDSSEVGMKMVEYLVLRLKEVKGLNLSIATRQSITDVVELRNHGWEPSRMGTIREKTSGQKKARAAARAQSDCPGPGGRCRSLGWPVERCPRAHGAPRAGCLAGPRGRACTCLRAGRIRGHFPHRRDAGDVTNRV